MGGIICTPITGARQGTKRSEYMVKRQERRGVLTRWGEGENMLRMEGMKTNQACFQGKGAN